MKEITITLTLTAEQAAGLKRFADKISFEDAMQPLYGHVKREIREEQVGAILSGFARLEKALEESRVGAWPWVETGRVSVY